MSLLSICYRGYGFVRFYNEGEIDNALTEMQGVKGLGERAIRVNKATKRYIF